MKKDRKVYKREWQKRYYLLNKEAIDAKNKKYNLENKERLTVYFKEYRFLNKELLIVKHKRYSALNRARINAKNKERKKTDVQFKISCIIRKRVGDAIRNNKRVGSAVRDLGCTLAELKMYIEGQFKDGMTWKNWSRKGWHLDHKIPLAFFDLTNREQFLSAVHYSNLQPLWAVENLSKGARIL